MNGKKTPEPAPARLSPCQLSLAVQYASAAQNLPTRAQLRRWVKAALRRDATMTLRIVDEAEGRELNKNYRGKDYATNVLTFVYDEGEPTPHHPLCEHPPCGLPAYPTSGGLTDSSPDKTTSHSTRSSKDDDQVAGYVKGRLGGVVFRPLCGDVVICAPVAEREASEQGKELAAHYAHLAIHAALHLQGHDHENDSGAAEMEALESRLMLKLRYPDPYQTTRTANG